MDMRVGGYGSTPSGAKEVLFLALCLGVHSGQCSEIIQQCWQSNQGLAFARQES